MTRISQESDSRLQVIRFMVKRRLARFNRRANLLRIPFSPFKSKRQICLERSRNI